MNCRQARTDLALWAGGDLSDSEARSLERHCAVCPDCRALREGLRSGQAALQAVAVCEAAGSRSGERPGAAGADSGSLWPAVSVRLARADAGRSRRFNGWAPALAVTAACVAVIFVAGQDAARQVGVGQSPHTLLQATPAAGPPAADMSLDDPGRDDLRRGETGGRSDDGFERWRPDFAPPRGFRPRGPDPGWRRPTGD